MIYYAHGDAIVSAEEIEDDPSLRASLSGFYKDLAEGGKPNSLVFSS